MAISRPPLLCDWAQRLADHLVCRANFRLFVLETIITVFGEYVSDYFKIQAVLLLVNGTMFYTIIRTLPYYSKSINNFQVVLAKQYESLGAPHAQPPRMPHAHIDLKCWTWPNLLISYAGRSLHAADLAVAGALPSADH